YYIRYHNKTPAVGFDGFGVPTIPGFVDATNAPWAYFAQYADDVNLIGASFATQVMGAAVSGEISYRWNDPVPINGLVGSLILPPDFGPSAGGTTTRRSGFVREKRLQFILNYLASFARGTRLIGPVVGWIGANDISFVAEWGLVYYPGLDESCLLVGFFGPTDESASTIQTGCTAYAGPAGTAVSVDEVSFGYQLRVGPTYFNPFGLPIRLLPSVSWQHDIDGVTPGLNPYIGERKGVNIGVEVIYLDTWTFRANYANFFGAGAANNINDRDFLSFSLSYAF
ncbi:MAG: DUF1302 family protein, partial [Ilumatobacteraceae bacterium]